MEYEIVKGLEIGETRGKSSRFPLASMEVGDAFVLPKDDKNALVSASSYFGARYNKKFSVRKYASDKYPDGYACKRVS